jgi:alkylhydroperoxidase family enzyme
VTHIVPGHVPDAVLEEARRQLNEKELADLTLVVATINAWNRLSIAARLESGTYQPATAAR